MEQQRLYTADEFWQLVQQPEYAHLDLELVNGELVIMPPPGGKHGKLALKLGALLLTYVDQRGLGEVAVETGYILSPSTVRAPDVSFVSQRMRPEGLPEGHAPFPPQLAIEVVSPGNSADDLQDKVLEYLSAGTEQVWVVYPRSQTVVVHTDNGAITYKPGDTVTGGTLLPGFTFGIDDLFNVVN